MAPRPVAGREFVLTLSCPDQAGLVHAVTAFLLRHGGNILESRQFDDRLHDMFFMRMHFEVPASRNLTEELCADFADVAERFRISWRLSDVATAPRTLIMVSKVGHCLNDLLFRRSTGALPVDVRAVVSNHPDLAPLADAHGIPFHHIPVTTATKAAAEARLTRLMADLDIDLVVLARYMQILSDDLCKRLDGRAINIHHSFLPSFKGARPYEQAYRRGVKLVGATAHYVTADLDEGPIIEQDIVRVDHARTPNELVTIGRDVEAQVLARAVLWHSENRVLLNGNRTVVFP